MNAWTMYNKNGLCDGNENAERMPRQRRRWWKEGMSRNNDTSTTRKTNNNNSNRKRCTCCSVLLFSSSLTLKLNYFLHLFFHFLFSYFYLSFFFKRTDCNGFHAFCAKTQQFCAVHLRPRQVKRNIAMMMMAHCMYNLMWTSPLNEEDYSNNNERNNRIKTSKATTMHNYT